MCVRARDRVHIYMHTNMLISINQLIYMQASKKTVYTCKRIIFFLSVYFPVMTIIRVFDSECVPSVMRVVLNHIVLNQHEFLSSVQHTKK